MYRLRLFTITTVLLIPSAAALAQSGPAITTIYDFKGSNVGDGSYPGGVLVVGNDGLIYGATGGGGQSTSHFGTVYSLTPPRGGSGAWTENVLFAFNGKDQGAGPGAGLALGSGGVLYGTTVGGGLPIAGFGVVYSLTPPAASGGAWTQRVLYTFQGGTDGEYPYNLLWAKDGTLYGLAGGPGNSISGIVFALTPPATPSGSWTETTIHAFNGKDGNGPSSLLLAGDGVLYGTTGHGGVYHYGTLFSLSPPSAPGGRWTETVIHSFGAPGDGVGPGGLTKGSGGVLYVAAGSTATGEGGVLYSFTPPAAPGGSWTQTQIYQFGLGYGSYYALAIGAKGELYGVGPNDAFRLTPPSSPGGAWTEDAITFPNAYPAPYPPTSALLPFQGMLIGASGGGFRNCGVGVGASCGAIYGLKW